MALAWKIMLPLGIVNFVAVAVFDQLRDLWGGSLFTNLLLVAASWGVCLGSWLVVSYAGPLVADNRPGHELASIEHSSQV